MPIVDDRITLDATNSVLKNVMHPAGHDLASLDSDDRSNKEWSCNTFAPALLEEILKRTGLPADGGEQWVYNRADPGHQRLPPDEFFPRSSFVNISSLFVDSSTNHNFNVYIDPNGNAYVIQAHLNYEVRICTRQPLNDFLANWRRLIENDWPAAYGRLFYVDPSTDNDNKLTGQYLTMLKGKP